MKFQHLPAILAMVSSVNAGLWLCTANMEYQTAVNDQTYPSPYCQVGKGDNREQAWSKATDELHGIALITGGNCDELNYQHTSQEGGFWDDYGTVNYEDDNWHWYCQTGGQGCCDGGDGAPKKKREVEFQS